MTGTGGLQRVPASYIDSLQIPLPPLTVQQEIVAEIENPEDNRRSATGSGKLEPAD